MLDRSKTRIRRKPVDCKWIYIKTEAIRSLVVFNSYDTDLAFNFIFLIIQSIGGCLQFVVIQGTFSRWKTIGDKGDIPTEEEAKRNCS